MNPLFRADPPVWHPPGMGISPALPPPMLMANGAWSHSARQAMPPGMMMPEDEQMQPGGLPPMMPFGGFRRNGGPVRPGMGYIVGEEGPEMIVPQTPGMVVPNGDPQRSGPLSDRGPAGPQTGPLSLRGPVPSGRGMTPARRMEIAERRAVVRGDAEGAAQWAGRREWSERMQPRMQMPPMGAPPGPTSMLPYSEKSGGRLVPGRGGSQVWQRNDDPPSGFLVSSRADRRMRWQKDNPASEPDAPEAPAADATLPPMLSNPLGQPPNPLLLPPSMFDAMNGPGQPPMTPGLYAPEPSRMTMEKVPGMAYGMPFFDGQPSKQLLPLDQGPPQLGYQNMPGTNQLVPMLGDSIASGLPVMQASQNPGWSVKGEPKARITPVEKPAKQDMPKFEYDDVAKKYFYFVPNEKGGFTRKMVDEDGNGVITPAESAAAQAAGQTKSGVKFSRVQ